MALPPPRGRAVPAGRLSRLAAFGSLAGGVAGAVLVDGAKRLASGQRPDPASLLLTAANARRITDQLANLRGAAMKMGQLLSMGGSEFLPPELSDILARLRADAQHMPPKQLEKVLDANWGKGWRTKFARFDVRPIAAASIGQVHRAQTRDGRDLAIKIQYPGVRKSIDSDVDNVGTLVRLSGLVPAGIDYAPLLAEAKRQLHEEADYEREAACLAEFGALLADEPDVIVPELHGDFTTRDVLAMSFVKGRPVESLETADQPTRDRVMTLLMRLLLRELFEFGLMQTDPNFANYRYDAESGRLVLLDFGATRRFEPEVAERYRRLMHAALAADVAAARPALAQAMQDIGFFGADTPAKHRDNIVGMFEQGMAPLRLTGHFDFSATEMLPELREKGRDLARDRDFWHVPPVDTLFLQRKFGGIFLLGNRLGATVDLLALLTPYRALNQAPIAKAASAAPRQRRGAAP
jgi:predicted unusual protein kinase regulating ubiquinone biosynthesis (AarF/ABC1/UbiB family)